MQGEIKKLISDKGYGFIKTNGEDDIFFHRSEVKDVAFFDLREGDTVEFETQDTFKGPQAVNLRLVE